MTNTSKNPVVRAAAGAAVLLVGLAGCASKTASPSTAAAGDGSGTSVVTTAPSSGSTATSLPSSAASTTAPAAPHQTLPIMTLPPVGGPSSPAPSGSLSPGEQVKYSTPVGVSVSKNGAQVSASVEWGGCTQQPQLIVISQDATKVVIELKTVSFYRLGAMCPDIARIGEADLTLSPPLGGRALVDGITHAVIPH